MFRLKLIKSPNKGLLVYEVNGNVCGIKRMVFFIRLNFMFWLLTFTQNFRDGKWIQGQSMIQWLPLFFPGLLLVVYYVIE